MDIKVWIFRQHGPFITLQNCNSTNFENATSGGNKCPSCQLYGIIETKLQMMCTAELYVLVWSYNFTGFKNVTMGAHKFPTTSPANSLPRTQMSD